MTLPHLPRRSTAALVAISFAFATSAFADRAGDLRCGVDAYERGDFEQAETCLRRAAGSSLAKERARAYLYLAQSQGARKQMAAARESFKSAIIEDPELEPDRERVPPEILVEYDAVRAIATGELIVGGDEPGARVLIDGQDRGAVPLSLRLASGARRVRVVSIDGYRRFDVAKALVRVGARTEVLASFRDQVGRVSVDVWPEGALVRVAGRPFTIPHKGSITLPAGKHRFVVSKPGFLEVERELVLETAQALVLRERLELQPRNPARWLGGWTAVGVGAASLVAASVLGAMASSSASDLTRQHAAGTLDTTTYLSLKSSAESRARWANVLFVTGGAAAATGVVLLLLSGRREASPTTKGALRVVPTPQGAALAFVF